MRWLLGWLVVLPLWVNLSATRPYEPIKIVMFEAGVAVAFAIAAFVVSRRGLRKEFRRIVDNAHALDAVVVLFIATLAVSTATSVDPRTSFWGSEERLTGLVFYWHAMLLYLIVRFYATKADWRFFARACCVVVIPISAYGVLQWFGVDFAGLERAFPIFGRSGPGRAFATLGHPNFLGAYLAMVTPIILWVLTTDSRKWWRITSIAAMLLLLGAITLTYSRGAWLALTVGVAAFIALGTTRSRRWYLAIAGGMTLALVIFFSTLIMLKPKLLASPNSFLFRLGSVVDMHHGSNLARASEWSHLLSFIPQRPLTGFGLDTYATFSAFRSKGENEKNRDFDYPDPSVADRAHNAFLDVLWAGGILSLVAYLAIIVLTIKKIGRDLANEIDRRFSAAIAAGLIAYLAANMLNFDFSVNGAYAFLFLAGAGYTEDT